MKPFLDSELFSHSHHGSRRLRRYFGSTVLTAAVALAVFAGSLAAAAEWHSGFEATEGYASGSPAGGEHVSIIGGEAAILTGDAAEGEQFLRYVPLAEDNALVVRMGEDVAGAASRSVQFAVRLSGEGQTARLVLSSGQTIGLQPVGGGVLIDVMGQQARLISLDGTRGWVAVGLHQNATGNAWDLTVGGESLALDLASVDPTEVLRDLLIFADGALDVDAIYVTTSEVGSVDIANEPIDDGGGTLSGSGPGVDATETVGRSDLAGAMPVGLNDEQILRALAQAGELRAMAEVKKRSDGTIPDGALLFPAKECVLAGDPVGAWKWLTLDREAYREARIEWAEVVGRRAAVVVGFLRNQSSNAEAVSFATFALDASELQVHALPGSKSKGQALYWQARLANEIFGRRDDALRWAIEADSSDPESNRIRALKAELAAAAAAFPEVTAQQP